MDADLGEEAEIARFIESVNIETEVARLSYLFAKAAIIREKSINEELQRENEELHEQIKKWSRWCDTPEELEKYTQVLNYDLENLVEDYDLVIKKQEILYKLTEIDPGTWEKESAIDWELDDLCDELKELKDEWRDADS